MVSANFDRAALTSGKSKYNSHFHNWTRQYAANFRDAKLDGARFQGATLDKACFENGSLPNTNFEKAALISGKWKLAQQRRFLSDRNMTADFRSATLDGAQFQGANLTNACFDDVSLVNANFTLQERISLEVGTTLGPSYVCVSHTVY